MILFQLLSVHHFICLLLILFKLICQKIYWVRVFEENMLFRILSYSQLIYFHENVRHKLTYFQLPFIISSLVDFKLFIWGKLASLINIVMVVEHILILIPLMFLTNVWHDFLMVKIHTFLFEFLYEGLFDAFLFLL